MYTIRKNKMERGYYIMEGIIQKEKETSAQYSDPLCAVPLTTATVEKETNYLEAIQSRRLFIYIRKGRQGWKQALYTLHIYKRVAEVIPGGGTRKKTN